jgi:Tfp pilus assembly protein PilE
VLTRLRQEKGFGMVELLMALTILNIGVLAIVAAFNSGIVSIRRAAKITTAAALLDTQMERYRAIKWVDIRLDSTAVTSANGDARYTGDTAWNASQVTGTCSGVPNECNPLRTAQGADGKAYRVDTYIVYDTPTNGRELKKITIVVRDGEALWRVLARETSTFDKSTGL